MSTENTPWAYVPPSPHKLKITAPPDLPDTGKGALPPIQPLDDKGRSSLPALGGPPLKHEYSESPYSNAVTSFADALTKQ